MTLERPHGLDLGDPAVDPEMLEGLLVLEPRAQFDPCIIGVVERFHDRFVLYSKRKVIEVLKADHLDDEVEDPDTAALEHYDFNMNGGWYGEATWGFLDDLERIDSASASVSAAQLDHGVRGEE